MAGVDRLQYCELIYFRWKPRSISQNDGEVKAVYSDTHYNIPASIYLPIQMYTWVDTLMDKTLQVAKDLNKDKVSSIEPKSYTIIRTNREGAVH